MLDACGLARPFGEHGKALSCEETASSSGSRAQPFQGREGRAMVTVLIAAVMQPFGGGWAGPGEKAVIRPSLPSCARVVISGSLNTARDCLCEM